MYHVTTLDWSRRTNLCHLGTWFKKGRFSPLWYLCAWDKDFFPFDYITRYLHTWVVLRLCIILIIGESPKVCSKYSHWYSFYWFEAGQKLVRSRSNYFYRTDNANCAIFFFSITLLTTDNVPLIVGVPFPLVFRAGYEIRLYRFLIITFLSSHRKLIALFLDNMYTILKTLTFFCVNYFCYTEENLRHITWF